MKKLTLLFTLLAIGTAYAQPYLEDDFGFAFKEKSKAVIMNLHAGYQVNKVLFTEGVALLEYNQRVLVGGGINPVYLGGRLGYGYNIGESATVSLFAAQYYRLLQSGSKNVNYWVPGYGLSVVWRNVSLDISNVEVYHVSIGCRYLFDFD